MRRFLALAAELALIEAFSLADSVSAVTENDLLEATRQWIEGDPDPETRDALRAIVDAGDRSAIADAMGEPLTFGTAGIRGEVGPGSGRMNRATVIRTTRGLADHLIDEPRRPTRAPVALGFDARPDSRKFAEDTAGVLAAAGIRSGSSRRSRQRHWWHSQPNTSMRRLRS